MLELDIPDFRSLTLKNLVCDFNGTLAVDGILRPGVADALNRVSRKLDVYIVTADTFGLAREALSDVNCRLTILAPGNQAAAKEQFVRRLGENHTIAFGNGRNDHLMLKAAAIGVIIMLDEGAACQAIVHADMLVPDILSGVALLEKPRRLIATLRG